MNTIDVIAKAELKKNLSRVNKNGNNAEHQKRLIEKAVNPEESLGIGYATVVLSRADFKDLSEKLIERSYWTDSLNSVGFNKQNNYIKDVGVGVFNPIKAGIDSHKMSVSDFSKMYAEIAAMNINDRPSDREVTENIYMDLVRYLDKNSPKK